jgi:NH3-dependent NAD+ synthetase
VTLRGMPTAAEVQMGAETSPAAVARRIDASIEWIRRTVKGKARGGLLVPLSGGTDSTVAFALCARALGPAQVRGFHFVPPGASADGAATAVADAHHPETTKALLRYCRDHVGAEAEVRLEALPHGLDAADPDMLRWAIAASAAKRRGAWLVGTRNRTEQLMGTYSVASTAATLQPLLDWWKADVMAAAETLAVPGSIVASSHAADPDCGRPAEMAEVGLSKIDWFVRCEWSGQRWRLGEHVSEAEAAYLRGIQGYNGFKARLPIDPRPWHDHEPFN